MAELTSQTNLRAGQV